MTNEQLLQKMKEDIELRGFSEYTKYAYMNKAKQMMKDFEKHDITKKITKKLDIECQTIV